MPTPEEHVYSALLSWHSEQLDRGTGPDRLPKLVDLRTIAETPGVNRQVLGQLTLVDEARLMPYATGVLSAVRTALRELAVMASWPEAAPAAPAAPVLEPMLVESAPTLPPPRRRTTSTTRNTKNMPAAATEPDPSGPAVSRSAAAPGPAALGDGGFLAHDLTRSAPLADVLAPSLKPQADGRLWIGWQHPADPAAVVLYRVVSRDDVMPWSPDAADPIGVTAEAELYDARPLPEALRHVQVWAHSGPDQVSARASQPVLHRAGTLIAPPGGLEFTEDHGTVVISWRPITGADEVEVRRVPLDEVAADVYAPEHVLLRDATRTTFQDTTCLPGQSYEYQLFSVLVDRASGSELASEQDRFRVQVSTSLVPVLDLQLTEHSQGDKTLVDLEWDQPPNAEVHIYRTQEPPAVDVKLQDVDVSALAGAGLMDADRQRQEPVVHAGRARMSGVGWPETMARVHLTAVTVHGRTARVGATATRTRTPTLTDQRLVQRVTWQLLTFSWPRGAAFVEVFTTPAGTGPEDISGPPLRIMLEAEYRRDGGIRLQLPWPGCAVHLVPVSFYDRRSERGEATSLSYRGLLILRYRFVRSQPPAPAAPARRWRRAPATPAMGPGLTHLELMHVPTGRPTGGPGQVPVVLTLTSHSQRLPLDKHDAEQVLGTMTSAVTTDGPAGWTPVGNGADFSSFDGHFLRLFASVDGATHMEVALLDPPLGSLRRR